MEGKKDKYSPTEKLMQDMLDVYQKKEERVIEILSSLKEKIRVSVEIKKENETWEVKTVSGFQAKDIEKAMVLTRVLEAALDSQKRLLYSLMEIEALKTNIPLDRNAKIN